MRRLEDGWLDSALRGARFMFNQYPAKSAYARPSKPKWRTLLYLCRKTALDDRLAFLYEENSSEERSLKRYCLGIALAALAAAQTRPAPSSPPASGPYAIIAMMRAVDASRAFDMEDGYIRHLEWHRQVKDKFNWYSYSFWSSAVRQMWIMYASFGHTPAELSNPVSPGEDQIDALINIPDVQYMGSSVYEFLPALSRGNSLPSAVLKAELTTVELNFGGDKAFEEALASGQSELQGETLWYRMTAGGDTPRYIRLRPRVSLENILNQRAGQALPDKVKALVSKMTVEILTLRPDMLVNVTPEPGRP
jgi:hypothetical protein